MMKGLVYSVWGALLLMLLPVFGFGQFSEAQLLFGETFRYHTLNYTLTFPDTERAIAVADFNNDGREDFVCSSFRYKDFHLDQHEYLTVIYVSNADGTFSDSTVVRMEDSHADYFVTDFDNNGYQDVLFENVDGVEVLYNFGSLSFVSEQITGLALPTVYEDVDGDGLKDILHYEDDLDELWWYRAVQVGEFVFEESFETGNGSGFVQLSDIDSDGDTDIILPARWLINDGSNAFSSEIPDFTSSTSEERRFELYDFDLDGDDDYLCFMRLYQSAFYDSVFLAIRVNDGLGNFSDTVLLGQFDEGEHRFFSDDDDGDGDRDIFFGGAEGVYRYENLGGLSFIESGSASLPVVGQNQAYRIVRGTNADPHLLICGTTQIYKIPILSSGGFGNIVLAIDGFHEYGNPFGVELTNDGLDDILLTVDGTLHYCVAQGGDEYEAPVQIESIIGTPFACDDFWLADFNEDGIQDILTRAGSALRWIERTDTATFISHAIGSVGATAFNDLAIVDRHEGFGPDIAVSTGQVTRKDYLNDGEGNFTITTNSPYYSGIQNPQKILSEDMDGDGDGELRHLILNGNELELSLFPGSGNVIASGFSEATDMVFADVNGNDTNDLVVTDVGANKIFWLRKTSPLTWAAPEVLLDNVYHPFSIKAGDLNGDGLDDLVFLFDYAELRYALNNGNGTFSSPVPIANYGSFHEGDDYELVDVDHDGRLDVLASSQDNHALWWYENFINSPFNISGQTFYDANANGTYDAGDFHLPQVNVGLNPNEGFVFSTDSGAYEFVVDSGAYEVVLQYDAGLWMLSTDSAVYHANVNAASPVYSGADFGFVANGSQPIANAEITVGFPRCSQVIHHWVSVLNEGNTLLDGVIQYELDASVSFVSSEPAPDSVVGATVFYTMDELGFGAQQLIDLQVQMPGATALNAQLEHELIVFGTNGDTLSSEAYTHGVFCSYDPNDKMEENGMGQAGYVMAGDELEYTVRFQNTGNDTAYVVVIRDALSDKLEWHTLQPLAWSHAVQTSVSVDGDVAFAFDNINLVDSATNPVGSQGFIKFRIKTKADLLPGDEILNTANIYFDQNPPITTNTEVNTIYDCSGTPSLLIGNYEQCAEMVGINAWAGEWGLGNYEWFLDDSLVSVGDHLLYEAEVNGEQWLYMRQNVAMCPAQSDSILLTANVPPIPEIELNDLVFCPGDSLLALDLSSATYDRLWYLDGLAVGSSDSLALELNVGSDTLVLVASAMFCPEAVDTVYFEMNEGPAAYFELGEFDTVCVNELINLSAINSLGDREWLIDGAVVSVFNSLAYTATETGIIELMLRSTSDFCGVAEYSDSITVVPNPTVSLTYDENTNQLIALPSGFTNYAWYYNGEIVNSTENVYDFEGNGGYRVHVTDEFGCKSFSDQVQLSVGIEEVANGMFVLSPNPNNGTFSVESETVGLVGYKLWDASGRLLQSESKAAVNRIKVETNLPAGVYLLHVATEQGFIKQRVVVAR